MSAPSISLRITGKNADGEYWLHLDGNPQKARLNLGDPAGMITSALLMAASGHTYTRTDAILSDPRVKALVDAAAVTLHDIDDLVANSEGVAGLHMNGDVACWESLMDGGAFGAWLSSVEKLRLTLAALKGASNE